MPFPNSPSEGDTATVGVATYRYNGSGWSRTGTIIGFTGPQGDTGPQGATGTSGTAGTHFSPKILTFGLLAGATLPALNTPIGLGDFTFTGITGATNGFDTSGMTFDLAEGSFTIKQDGVYALVSGIELYANIIRYYPQVYFQVNGNRIAGAGGGYIRAFSQFNTAINAERIIRLSANDIIEFIYENTGYQISLSSSILSSRFQIVRLY